MEVANSTVERRELSRVSAGDLEVDIRPQGRLARLQADAVDFNRYGVAVLTRTPLKEQKNVYISLKLGELRLDNLLGVVHNCCHQDDGFRSGIRFRTHAALQTDRALVELLLTRMEDLARSTSDTL